jgi:ketosteroid isomerase-like protein
MKNTFYSVVLLIVIGTLGITIAEVASQTKKPAVSKQLESLLQVDRNFDKDVAEKGVEAWVSYFANDSKMFRAGGIITEGKDEIRTLMTPVFATPGFSLRWEPISGDIAKSGDLGYTYGISTAKTLDKDGKEQIHIGKYVTIWKKQSDGSWKAVLDIGTGSAQQEKK